MAALYQAIHNRAELPSAPDCMLLGIKRHPNLERRNDASHIDGWNPQAIGFTLCHR